MPSASMLAEIKTNSKVVIINKMRDPYSKFQPYMIKIQNPYALSIEIEANSLVIIHKKHYFLPTKKKTFL